MNARLSLVERLRIGQAALALAEAKRKEAPEPVPVVEERPEPFDREASMKAAKLRETFPICGCGIRKVLCVGCGEFYCGAPGHELHVCRAPEFSQLENDRSVSAASVAVDCQRSEVAESQRARVGAFAATSVTNGGSQ